MIREVMALIWRVVRAVWVLGRIFLGYALHLSLRRLLRRWEIDPSTGRERARLPVWLDRQRQRIDQRSARRLLAAILELRGLYIKLGQVLSILGGFLPTAFTKELESLQDAVPPRPFTQIREAMHDELGRPPSELFATIDELPIAAASLGQVHRATLQSGENVAVKVLYPNIRDEIRMDMAVIRLAMRVYGYFLPVQNLEGVHTALVDLLRRETDYLHEAACMRRIAENFQDEGDIVVPEVIESLTTRGVLTMTFMEGIKISHVEQMRDAGIDPHRVARRLIESFYKQLFVHRLFHADPHPGNFLVQRGPTPETPRIVILDFGAVCEVSEEMVDGMVDVLRGFFEKKDELVMRGIEKIGFFAPEGDRALLERTVKTYFAKLLQLKRRSVKAIQEASIDELGALADPEVERRRLRELMRSVRYPDGWFYVERAAVLMFWLVGTIDPDIDALQVGFPYLLPLLAARTTPLHQSTT